MMKKRLLFWGALVGAFFFLSCSGNNKNQRESANGREELDNASKVINYYHTSLILLRHVANAKDVNAVLGYMEQQGKVPVVSPIAPPEVSEKDTMEVMNPGTFFTKETRQNLRGSFAQLFHSRAQFYANFNQFLACKKAKDAQKAADLLHENYDLSVEMSEYKQVIFDILSPLTEQAEYELLIDEPLKKQIISMRKISATVQGILNLYSRKHIMDGPRIDLKMAELRKELEAAKKLAPVSGYDEEMTNYHGFLLTVESFIKDMQKAREKGAYSDEDYKSLSESYEYGLSVI